MGRILGCAGTMNLSIVTSEDDAPLQIVERLSPMKLGDDKIKKFEIVSASKRGKGKSSPPVPIVDHVQTAQSAERQRVEGQARRELQAQQERVYSLLLQTASSSMFEAEEISSAEGDAVGVVSRRDYAAVNGEACGEILSPPASPSEMDSERLEGAVAGDEGLSPAVFTVHRHGRGTGVRYNNDMNAMFASLETPDGGSSTRGGNKPSFAGMTTPFYGQSPVAVGDVTAASGDIPGDGDECFPGISPPFSFGYQLAVDTMLQRDLESPLSSEGALSGDGHTCYTPPVSASPTLFGIPTITAPLPPEPQPQYAPLYTRIDTSKAILVDEGHASALELLAGFGRFLQSLTPHQPGVTCGEKKGGDGDDEMSRILNTHRKLVQSRIL